MRTNRMLPATIAALVAGGAMGSVVALGQEGSSGRTPAESDPAVPRLEQDRGVGERLLLVVGGTFPTREAAEAANDQLSFGDVQGFYVAATDQFVGLEEVLGEAADEYVLVSAFRTGRGAREFLDLTTAVGASAFVTPRLQNRGFEYVGLGQEPDPDGIGPLTDPIPGVTVP
jgi:hypothetical protein